MSFRNRLTLNIRYLVRSIDSQRGKVMVTNFLEGFHDHDTKDIIRHISNYKVILLFSNIIVIPVLTQFNTYPRCFFFIS